MIVINCFKHELWKELMITTATLEEVNHESIPIPKPYELVASIEVPRQLKSFDLIQQMVFDCYRPRMNASLSHNDTQMFIENTPCDITQVFKLTEQLLALNPHCKEEPTKCPEPMKLPDPRELPESVNRPDPRELPEPVACTSSLAKPALNLLHTT